MSLDEPERQSYPCEFLRWSAGNPPGGSMVDRMQGLDEQAAISYNVYSSDAKASER